MKKVLLSVLFVLTGIAAANAQAGAVEVGTPYSASQQKVQTPTAPVSSGPEVGGNIGVAPKEGAFGMNFDITIGMVGFGFDYYTGTGDYDTKGWDITLGANERIWFGNNMFYLEAAGGLALYHSSLSYTDYYTKKPVENTYTNVGLYMYPRVGFRTKSGYGAFVAYRWDMPEFKFNSDNSYFSIGISYVM